MPKIEQTYPVDAGFLTVRSVLELASSAVTPVVRMAQNLLSVNSIATIPPSIGCPITVNDGDGVTRPIEFSTPWGVFHFQPVRGSCTIKSVPFVLSLTHLVWNV